MSELYETTYTSARHFSFGRNWQNFLTILTDERIRLAQQSLAEFLGDGTALVGRSFVDIGSGSGLFSLAAYRLGARPVVSLDVDQVSLSSTETLHDREGSPEHWRVLAGSALDEKFLSTLGTFDVVYAWGVLHHTGDMDQAIKNVSRLVGPHGQLYLAIYNESTSLTHGTSQFWRWVKRTYNTTNTIVKRVIERLYAGYLWIGLLLLGRNPAHYIRDYRSARGMSWRHDLVDWLGGYPYEFARPEQIINALGMGGFACTKLTVRPTIGCNEYLFVRRPLP